MLSAQKIHDLLLRATPGPLKPYCRRLGASPLAYRLAASSFWSFFGTAISRVLGLLASVLVGRILGKGAFGELGTIQGTAGLFGTVAGLGMGMAVTKYAAEFSKTDPAKAGRIISLASATSWITSSLLGAILYMEAPWLAQHTLAAPQLAPLLRASALLLVFSVATSAPLPWSAASWRGRRPTPALFCGARGLADGLCRSGAGRAANVWRK
jgi:peptidoglycan biosynthesis protein MviN/MurJ (putative lipid II flippase)